MELTFIQLFLIVVGMLIGGFIVAYLWEEYEWFRITLTFIGICLLITSAIYFR